MCILLYYWNVHNCKVCQMQYIEKYMYSSRRICLAQPPPNLSSVTHCITTLVQGLGVTRLIQHKTSLGWHCPNKASPVKPISLLSIYISPILTCFNLMWVSVIIRAEQNAPNMKHATHFNEFSQLSVLVQFSVCCVVCKLTCYTQAFPLSQQRVCSELSLLWSTAFWPQSHLVLLSA